MANMMRGYSSFLIYRINMSNDNTAKWSVDSLNTNKKEPFAKRWTIFMDWAVVDLKDIQTRVEQVQFTFNVCLATMQQTATLNSTE